MSYELTVLHAFGPHAKGDTIHDQDEVKKILSSEHAHNVVKVAIGTHSAVEAEPAEKAADEVKPAEHDEHQA